MSATRRVTVSGNRSLGHDVFAVITAVLRTPTRLRRLVRLGPRGWISMGRFLTVVVPRASRALAAIRGRAAAIPDPLLRRQALVSIADKAYHVQGGAILATFLSGRIARQYIEIVAPLETIYDYLDNLCDRLGSVSAQGYATLHEAVLDALDDRRPVADYYRYGPAGDDGGYLHDLVMRVRTGVTQLRHYEAVREPLVRIAGYYAELQTFKHAPPGTREALCAAWYERNRVTFPGLHWWEFAAACGSSLPVFALLYVASSPALTARAVERTVAAYVPAVSALHILLDYFIDQAEDREHRELNFVACYPSVDNAVQRIGGLIAAAAERLAVLADAKAHEFVLQAMCLFYLTHPKVFEQHLDAQSVALLAAFDRRELPVTG